MECWGRKGFGGSGRAGAEGVAILGCQAVIEDSKTLSLLVQYITPVYRMISELKVEIK